MNKAEFCKTIKELGVDQAFFVDPKHASFFANNDEPKPKSIIALVKTYQHFVAPKQTLPFSSYYIASNSLYFIAKELQARFKLGKPQNINAKQTLVNANIGAMGQNTLVAIKDIGSFFAVEFLQSDFWQSESYDCASPCLFCKNCLAACPTKAIDNVSGYQKEKCVRFYMEGYEAPDWVKKNIPSLFGCEVCQRVCKRNLQSHSVQTPKFVTQLFNEKNIIEHYDENKKAFAKIVGKNMLSRKRLVSQTNWILKK